MIILSEKDVEVLLPIEAAISAVADVMVAVSQGRTNLPLRSIMDVAAEGGPANKMGIMPGALGGDEAYGIKLVSLFPGNPAAGYSSHGGAILLFEPEHGRAIALMNAGLLTALRTAAASAVATCELARLDASVLTIVGTGEQAYHHLDAMAAVRPLEEVRIVARSAEKARVFARSGAARYPGFSFTTGTDVAAAVKGTDIVCTVTSAAEPILFGEWLEPGTHLNVVGASIPSKREIDEETVARSRLFVDYRPSTFAQAGEVIGALESGRIDKGHVLAEIGEVLTGSHPGRTNGEEITLYRSLGVAAQDLACAARCVAAAKAKGLGVVASID